ncbi:hypothetical protein AMAG_04249 [Allomyces macrogynus ATCC 38327]|uniref:V-type proton ATPase subunit a n=1 Tax=Allomyces macrogynus (strain ATCC 38327) TaxID=578462 RepID=A0A0L0S8G7_ALLM3|nr:hypothetical protein, variant [Allomyces macrogynus ATCC 38327]KNE58696.1 hypothetical protein AMAG_04249 [Allomyces macrogynus ATCC 38327]|eukprot:KNE58695.1 hypothetical protein, variant [Allomyces macrogynus ATCC 38327]
MADPGADTAYVRSEPMSLVQLYIPLDIAQATVSELGELGVVQFRDRNPDVSAFQRTYVSEIRRLDEMDRRLRFLWQQAEKANVTINTTRRGPSPNSARRQQELDELDALLADTEARILQMNSSQAAFNKTFLELTELRHVLRETTSFFEEAEAHQSEIIGSAGGVEDTLLGAGPDVEANEQMGGHTIQIGFVAGVLDRKKALAFERILWRALRGNLYLKSAEIEEPITDPTTDEQVYKNVFVIFAHGNETLHKIRRLSESLGATLYPVDANSEKRRQDARAVLSRLEDLNQVLFNTSTTRRHELSKLADQMGTWNTLIQKEKAVYHTMNLFSTEANQKALIAEGWVPTAEIARVQSALAVAREAARGMMPTVLNVVPTAREPPTYHKANKFTAGFQAIIDAYGIARYREINPGLFTVITFPFLFAVMFGDFGHGIIVTLVGAYLCLKEDQLKLASKGSESMATIYGGRYMILLMGLFSMYTGLIYNDAFSRMMSIFPSGWTWVPDAHEPNVLVGKQVGTYPFGLDWAWQFADNKLIFGNSYKMKMSIIFGVIHMTFATILSLFNHLHFKKKINVYCMFIPQILFMQCIFGYLVVCMIYKWLVDWSQPGMPSPPGLLNMLIFMFLSPGKVKKGEELFAGQATVQMILLGIAMICVPWMLCVKPYLLKKEHDRTIAQGYATLHVAHGDDDDDDDPHNVSDHALMGGAVPQTASSSNHVAPSPAAAPGAPAAMIMSPVSDAGGHGHGHDGEPWDFGALVIDQVIHTIEYCLGCISNTASYLRLWALSLAHAQLSEVLWDMTLSGRFEAATGSWGQAVALVLIFPMWFGATVFILLLMEGLSAFLHALRLHWVEFDSKFLRRVRVQVLSRFRLPRLE